MNEKQKNKKIVWCITMKKQTKKCFFSQKKFDLFF